MKIDVNEIDPITREEARRDLYDRLKDRLIITYGEKKQDYTFAELEKGKTTKQLESLYQVFGMLYFTSVKRLKKFPKSSGTLDLFKIYKGKYTDSKVELQEFFDIYACDLPYAKISEYCRPKPVNPKDYVGDYELYIYGTDTEYDTAKIEFKLDISMSDALQMSFVKKFKYFRFKYQNKTDSFDLLDEDSTTKLGQIKFSRGEDGEVDGMEFIEFEEGGMPVKLEGIKITEGEIEVDFDPYDENQDEDKPQDNTPPKKEDPKPSPPKPKYSNYCSDMSWPWLIGCQNGYIEVLNDRVLGKKGDPTLSQELIQNLLNLSVLSSGATNISRDDFNNRVKPTYGKYFENVIKENHIKKVIKESTRRILRDIYNRT